MVPQKWNKGNMVRIAAFAASRKRKLWNKSNIAVLIFFKNSTVGGAMVPRKWNNWEIMKLAAFLASRKGALWDKSKITVFPACQMWNMWVEHSSLSGKCGMEVVGKAGNTESGRRGGGNRSRGRGEIEAYPEFLCSSEALPSGTRVTK